jgi:hypothetical protein
MSYVAHSAIFHGHLARQRRAAGDEASARPGFLSRLFDAMFESRQRAAEREAEVYLARTGGRFTDSIEREINERHFNGGWNPRR